MLAFLCPEIRIYDYGAMKANPLCCNRRHCCLRISKDINYMISPPIHTHPLVLMIIGKKEKSPGWKPGLEG